MTEWYPCKWCEGEGGWHAHDEPSYSNPGETIAKLRVELEQARFQDIKEEGNFLSTAVLENALDEADSFRYRVKVLEDALERIKSVVTYPCDTSIQERGYGTREIDITGCEYIAEIVDLSLSKARYSQPQKGKSE